LFRKAKLDQEMDEEMRSHIEMRTQANIEAGMKPEEARYAALRNFGGMDQVKEVCRDLRGVGWIETLWQDVRFGLRLFRRNPGFAAVAVATFALGIGANTSIFTIADQVLLRALPVKAPGSLVIVVPEGKHIGASWGAQVISYPMFKDFQQQNDIFAGVLCRGTETVAMSDKGEAERVEIELASANYFDVLGVRPGLGRTFVPDDETAPGANPVVVLEHDYWRIRFGGDPSVLGRTLRINGSPMAVVGVAAPGFHGVSLDSRPKMFIPITMKQQVTPGWNASADRRTRWVRVLARLKPGISREQAAASLQVCYRQILEQEAQGAGFEGASRADIDEFLRSRVTLNSGSRGQSFLSAGLQSPLYVLLALAGLVLVVSCASVSNLLIAQATRRRTEITVRLALGAGRRRILRQLLTESLLLALIGSVVALLVSTWTTRGVLLFAPVQVGRAISPAINWRTLVFTILVTVIATILSGVMPAWRCTQDDLVSRLKKRTASLIRGPGARLRQGLVIAQVGLSVTLLIGAGLFVCSLLALYRLDPGFRPTNLIRFKLDPMLSGYDWQRTGDFDRRLRSALASLPGVDSAALARIPVLEANCWIQGVVVEGYPAKEGEDVCVECNSVSPGYCRTMGMPVKLGREFDEREDIPGGVKVAMVNEAFVRHFIPAQNPLGSRVGFRSGSNTQPDLEIIGVVQDSRNGGLRWAIVPQVFVPSSLSGFAEATVYVRTSLPSAHLFQTIRAQVRQLDPIIPVYEMRTMEDHLDKSLALERLLGFLSSLFGMLAGGVALVGLYGVTSFLAGCRTQEIGIRMALGAQRWDVLRLVLGQATVLVGIGLSCGLVAALVLTRILRSLLFEIKPTDPLIFASVTLLLGLVALAACWLPARRAAKVNPTVALRHE
jgi:predicted permease